MNQLRAGGPVATSFANAFVAVKTAEIKKQIVLDVDLIASDPSVTFVNQTGVIRNVQGGQELDFTAQVTGDSGRHSFDLLFVRQGTNSILGSIPVTLNTSYRYPVLATDPDGDVVTYRLVEAPNGASIHPQTGHIQWNPPTGGNYRFVVQADDGRGGTDTQEYVVKVTLGQPNHAPLITSTPPERTPIGRPFTYAVAASDADDDLLSYALTDAPEGMAIDSTTGLITWTPTAGQLGANEVTVQVRDGRQGEAAQTFTIQVVVDSENQAPRFVSTPGTAAIVERSYSYQARAADANSDPLQFDLVVKPEGMTVDAATGMVNWRPKGDQVGPHDVFLRVRDGRGGMDLQTYQIVVSPANTAPVITSEPVSPAAINTPYRYEVCAQDAEGDVLTYRLENAPAGMTMHALTGVVNWTPTAGQLGSHRVVVVVADAAGAEARQAFTLEAAAVLANRAPEIRSTPRTVLRFGDGYFYAVDAVDADADPITFTLENAPAGMSVDANGLLRWTPTAAQFGLNQVSLLVSDGRGGTARQSFTIDVRAQSINKLPAITSVPLLSAVAGKQYAYNARANDAEGDPLVWSLDVAPSGMSVNFRKGTVRWTPEPYQVGTHQVVLRAADAQGGFALQSFTIVVRPGNSPPAITSVPTVLAGVGFLYSYDVEAVDPDGDVLGFALAAGTPAGMSIDPSTGSIQWTPDLSQLGQHAVGVLVQDGQGGTVAQTWTLIVGPDAPNQAPVIHSMPVLGSLPGEDYQYQVAASDPEGDLLTYTLGRAPAGLTLHPTTGLMEWTPAAEGRFPVYFWVSDPSGNTAAQGFVITVRRNNAPPSSSRSQ